MLRSRQKLGKYVIERKLGEGGFAVVYQARDTIEGVRVALKMPYAHMMNEETLDLFRREVRISARLDHPNILPLKYADFIDGRFVIVTLLGKSTLEERLRKRLSTETALSYSKQMLSAVACAHQHRIIHCDLKPDNWLICDDNRIRLMDFGIARVAQKTIRGSGAGTVGYIAPEQALGKPSFRSDVFSLGIILYRMFTGCIPEWPFQWPPPGVDRLKSRVHPDMVSLIQKAIAVDAQRRFRDAVAMNAAFLRIRQPLKRKGSVRTPKSRTTRTPNWEEVRRREFLRLFGRQLEAKCNCHACGGPVAEAMQVCPWCGVKRDRHSGEKTRFSLQCPRCHRGMKADWSYCPWCYGPGFEPSTNRSLPDKRYVAQCDNPKCSRKSLMPFMKYCPWCRRRVRKKWRIETVNTCCESCGHGVLPGYWSFCPWCGKKIGTR